MEGVMEDGARDHVATGGDRIVVKGLGKKYGALQVFQDIDISFGEREIVTVVGPIPDDDRCSGCATTVADPW